MQKNSISNALTFSSFNSTSYFRLCHKNKKSSQNQTKPGLRPVLIILPILIAVAVFFRYYVEPRQEAAHFAQLKQDVLALQQEFNKVDPGWEYSEGCVGKGGVYEQNTPYYCSIDISRKNTTPPSELSLYVDILAKQKFTSTSSSKNLFEIKSKEFKNCNCTLQSSQSTGNSYYDFSCSAPAREFYFKRTDL